MNLEQTKKGRGSHLTTRVDLQMSQGKEDQSGGTVDWPFMLCTTNVTY